MTTDLPCLRSARRIDLRFFRMSDGRRTWWDVRTARGYPLPESVRTKVLTWYPDDMTPHPQAAVVEASEGEPLYELDEAADPTTPGDRLRELAFATSAPDLCQTAMRNPSLPLRWLAARLRVTPGPGPDFAVHLAAWHNPAVPLLLLSEPLPDYQRAALRALERLTRSEGIDVPVVPVPLLSDDPLADAVALWIGRQRGYSEARDFARHLASLFGLPWPEQPTPLPADRATMPSDRPEPPEVTIVRELMATLPLPPVLPVPERTAIEADPRAVAVVASLLDDLTIEPQTRDSSPGH